MVFFDLDGPILDVSDKYYAVYRDTMIRFGFQPIPKEQYWNLKRSKTPEREILSLSGAHDVEREYKKIRNSIIETEHYLQFDRVWPELYKTYQELFKKERCILVTLRTFAEMTHFQLKKLNIHNWFYKILSRPSDLPQNNRWMTKVNAIEEFLIEINCCLSDLFFVGDTQADIKTGKHFGMKTIAVSFGIQNHDMLVAGKPDYIFDTPNALKDFIHNIYFKR